MAHKFLPDTLSEMSTVALIVLFNHRYDANIPVIDAMMRSRFPDIYYIVPFYDGDREDVIPVYGRSIFFESYIAQAWNVLRGTNYKHYLIVADDMLLNPNINHQNYKQYFGVNDFQSFIPALKPIHTLPYYWIGTMSAFTYSPRQKYVETKGQLPSCDEAWAKMEAQGIKRYTLSRRALFHDFTLDISSMGAKVRLGLRALTKLRHPFRKVYELKYPMVASYSDILLVAHDDMSAFCRYCGIFGATSLFVEVAIPTALVLAANEKIVTEQNLPYKGRSYWSIPQNVFCEDASYTWSNLENEYKNLDDIINRFPDDAIYIHPIKLSKWKSK